MPTPEEVEQWTAAIREIMERDGVTEEEANIGLVWAVTDWVVQEEIKELAKHREDVELWTTVIRDLQTRFPEWTEQECNDNLIALLEYVEAHHEGA